MSILIGAAAVLLLLGLGVTIGCAMYESSSYAMRSMAPVARIARLTPLYWLIFWLFREPK